MLEFVQWLKLQPLGEDLADAKASIGRALVQSTSRDSSGVDILPFINDFKDALQRCSNKASQGDDDTLAQDLVSIFGSLSGEADEAVSESDPGLRRYMLSGLLRRIDSEIVGKAPKVTDVAFGDIDGRSTIHAFESRLSVRI
jgi:hypothetical protein